MTNTKRLPFDRRVTNPPPMRLTQRDQEIVAAVYTYRLLSRSQLELLFFGSRSPANYRLQRLYHHGYLNRLYVSDDMRYNARNTQALYCLDEAGADMLALHWGVPREQIRWNSHRNNVREYFIQHLLQINNCRIALTLAANARGDEITTWIPDWELRDLNEHVTDLKTGVTYPVFPDAYFVYKRADTGKSAHCFLELDMSTMEQRRFAQKIRAYMLYAETGRYFERYQTNSMRVLTVAPTQRRVRNLKATTEEVGGENRYWFGDHSILTPERILQPVWAIAGQDELASIVGTRDETRSV